MTRMTEARTRPDPLTRLATGRFGRAYRRGVAVALRPAYGIYESRLSAAVMALPRPKHVAVIMDGNRRWAAAEGYKDLGIGHRRGAEKALEMVDWCADLGIWEVTLWALSLENLERPARKSPRSRMSRAKRSMRSRRVDVEPGSRSTFGSSVAATSCRPASRTPSLDRRACRDPRARCE